MRNHFVSNEVNEDVSRGELQQQVRGESNATYFLEKQTIVPERAKPGKQIGRSDGAGRVIFYRDENDGNDFIL